ncbi:MAG: hypothetical protein ACK5NT_09980 [Pyrinomonadaceae bacterium]
MLKTMIFVIVAAVLFVPLNSNAQSQGTWENVMELVGKEVKLETLNGEKVFGEVKVADESQITIRLAGEKALSDEEKTFEKDNVKKIWRALLFAGKRNTAKGALIGAGVGAAIGGGIAASKDVYETGERATFTVLGAVVGAGIGSGIGALMGLGFKSKHKRGNLIYEN